MKGFLTGNRIAQIRHAYAVCTALHGFEQGEMFKFRLIFGRSATEKLICLRRGYFWKV